MAQAAATDYKNQKNQFVYREGQRIPDGAVTVHSIGKYIYIKQSQDPATQGLARRECRPGASFLVKEGSEWKGPQGGIWMEHATSPCWLRVEDQVHGKALLKQEDA